MIGKETFELLNCSLRDSLYWSVRRDVIEGRVKIDGFEESKVCCYECHDGKMLYNLTQHSQWNRKHHPFLLCKCNREDGLENSDHVCDMWTNDSYQLAWQRSQRRFEFKSFRDPTYDEAKYRSWCDSDNFGVTHYGIHPSTLKIEEIRMDVFHCKCAIIRRMMSCTRQSILKHSTFVVKQFTDEVLKQMFTDFHIYCWNNGFNFNKFHGHDLSMFVFHSDKVINFFRSHLTLTKENENLIQGLSLLKDIFTFLTLSHYDDKVKYLEEIERYEKQVSNLFKFGKESFLKKESGGVTFYFHVLRYYFPIFAKKSANQHNLGVGIFSMQGFERRNKESKNTLKRFTTSNRKSKKLILNNIRRLMYVFLFENNAY